MLKYTTLITLTIFNSLFLCNFCQAISICDDPLDTTYRAAKYSIIIDFSKIQNVVQWTPKQLTTYSYYIQYGKDKVIEISDPGLEGSNLPIILVEWNYKTNIKTEYVILRNVKLYHKSADTIKFCINENIVFISDSCNHGLLNLVCDSLLITNSLDSFQTMVYLHDSIKNIPVFDLFYPNVQYLPTRIVPITKRRGIRVLESVIFNKEEIDNLLNNYSLTDYVQISDAEMNFSINQIDIESIKKMVPD